MGFDPNQLTYIYNMLNILYSLNIIHSLLVYLFIELCLLEITSLNMKISGSYQKI